MPVPIDRSAFQAALDYITHHRQIGIVEMAGLGTGVFCVYDTDDEFEIFFNRQGWDLRSPEIWGGSAHLPDFGLLRMGYLCGNGFAPRIRTYESALTHAKEELKPLLASSEFYEKPLLIDRLGKSED